ncbi:MAG: 3' terminal RNA ribose 2'-O-methyltransferase Hen1 [Sandaracinaceae bacterium]|nr:3' terminal RNA ribose 2'-O-methyltransferase Hen1 [Sandaracinaceae bacterium]
MLLTLTTTHQPATDLGYLLGKNPSRTQSFELAWGRAHVFYPEATRERCTAALLVDVDPIGLVKAARRASHGESVLAHYVNDRPYAACSLTSVAIAQVLGSALSGKSRERQALADTKIPLEARVSVVRGGERLIRALFAPLGWSVELERLPLDPRFPSWGGSPYHALVLRGEARVSELLSHLYVLIPVLDDDKHYYVGEDEVDKLLAHGEGWLASHPERETIAGRYLKRQRKLTRAAIERLRRDETADPDAADEASEAAEEAIERRVSLDEERRRTVALVLKEHGARRVGDLGCGEGKLLRALFADPFFERIVGVDVSLRALTIAQERLRWSELSDAQRSRIELLHGSALYRDARLRGLDALCLVEVIEHVDPPRLGALEKAVFAGARPRLVVVTTPNVEHNARFGMAEGKLRHADHRFEWTRAQMTKWCAKIARRYDYHESQLAIGPDDPEVGPPTQVGVFVR